MQPTALVTAVGSTTGLSVVKALRAVFPRVRVLGVDTHAAWQIAGSTMVDGYCRVPRADHPEYVIFLRHLCREENVEAVFPIVEPELEVLSAVTDQFLGDGVDVWVSSAATVAMANDKWLTHLFLQENNFPTPEAWLPETLPGAVPLPLVVKPRRGVSSRNVAIVHRLEALRRALENTEEPIIQRYLEGPEYTVDVVADDSGSLLGVVPRLRIEVRGGLSYRGLTVDEPGLVTTVERLAACMGLRGPANVQCRQMNGEYYIFEINPRFSGSLPLTVAAGVNGPALLWACTQGEQPARLYPQAGVHMARYWQETFSHGIAPERL